MKKSKNTTPQMKSQKKTKINKNAQRNKKTKKNNKKFKEKKKHHIRIARENNKTKPGKDKQFIYKNYLNACIILTKNKMIAH